MQIKYHGIKSFLIWKRPKKKNSLQLSDELNAEGVQIDYIDQVLSKDFLE